MLPQTFSKMDRKTWIVWLFFLFLLHPTLLYGLPFAGVDNSWKIAINWAVHQHWVFGRDIVFTYGPLGYLGGTFFDYGVSKWAYFFYNLGLWALMGFAILKVLQEIKSLYAILFMLLGITLLYTYFDRFFISFYLQIFLSTLILRQEVKEEYALHVLSLLSVFLFFSKLNVGLVSVFVHVVFLLYLLGRKKITSLVYG